MAWYNVENEVKKIAEMTNKEIKMVAAEFELVVDGNEIFATNRRGQSSVKLTLADLTEKAKTAVIKKEVKAGFHWVKDTYGEWAVAGDFTGKQIGDTIEVKRMDGTVQEKEIIELTSCGTAYVS